MQLAKEDYLKNKGRIDSYCKVFIIHCLLLLISKIKRWFQIKLLTGLTALICKDNFGANLHSCLSIFYIFLKMFLQNDEFSIFWSKLLKLLVKNVSLRKMLSVGILGLWIFWIGKIPSFWKNDEFSIFWLKLIKLFVKNSSNLLAANLHICLSIINSRLKNSKFWKNPKSKVLKKFCKNPKSNFLT